jgi:hypothetical protein
MSQNGMIVEAPIQWKQNPFLSSLSPSSSPGSLPLCACLPGSVQVSVWCWQSSAKQLVSGTRSWKSKVDAGHVIEVQRALKDNISKNIKSKSTSLGYKGYRDRTLAYVERLKENENREEMTRRELTNIDDLLHGDSDKDPNLDKTERMAKDPKFFNALKGAPNKYTPTLIAMFMNHKCFTEKCSVSYASSIHAAWKDHYKHL